MKTDITVVASYYVFKDPDREDIYHASFVPRAGIIQIMSPDGVRMLMRARVLATELMAKGQAA